MTTYEPPKIWQWDSSSGGKWAQINRPIAGATHDKTLPVGDHPLQLYSLGTPNGQKATIMLEELLADGIEAAEYDAWLVNIGEGDQFGSDFVKINPNSKIPALLDRSVDPAIRVFESASIVTYLANKFERFIPEDATSRAQCFNWLFWQQGAAPFVGGGFGHFYAYAPEKFEYAINRYTMETKRLLDVLNRHLSDNDYLTGAHYSIADIATWPWFGALALGKLYDAAEFLQVQDYEHVRRWAEQVGARPAVQRGRRVNRVSENETDLVRERHSAADLD
ncbi:MAG: glutathione-dependent disulfide-bond oxidoreductase [Pseudomonadota bacterium]